MQPQRGLIRSGRTLYIRIRLVRKLSDWTPLNRVVTYGTVHKRSVALETRRLPQHPRLIVV